jgi:hypothetical protein
MGLLVLAEIHSTLKIRYRHNSITRFTHPSVSILVGHSSLDIACLDPEQMLDKNKGKSQIGSVFTATTVEND